MNEGQERRLIEQYDEGRLLRVMRVGLRKAVICAIQGDMGERNVDAARLRVVG